MTVFLVWDGGPYHDSPPYLIGVFRSAKSAQAYVDKHVGINPGLKDRLYFDDEEVLD